MAERSKSRAALLEELLQRIERLESEFRKSPEQTSRGEEVNAPLQFCNEPNVPDRVFGLDVSPSRARLIRTVSKTWVNGTTLRYYFFTHGPFAGRMEQQDIVREGFDIWRDIGIGIRFEEVVDISEAEIRIGFLQGDGAWSYVGRDVIDIPLQGERTMNFGWDLTRDPRREDVAVHEIGHTLGFPHEHQNPFAGIKWDEDAVYSEFGGPPNSWSRETTYHNILRKLPRDDTRGSSWDPDSIMHYSFGGGLILEPPQYRGGLTPSGGLSEQDIKQALYFYPPIDEKSGLPLLKAFRSEALSLGPTEQKDFEVKPDATRDYSIQTFGPLDAVIVLFEDQDGELRYVAGSDDSGTPRNACITVRLYKSRRYVLRIRCYANIAAGDTAVMIW